MIYSALSLRILHGRNDPCTLLNQIGSTSLMSDRFDILNKYSSWNIGADPDVPMPKYQFNYHDIGEALDNATLKIIKENKPITLMWSGGVDSTALLVSFIKHQYKDLTIVSSAHIFQENPTMAAYLLKNKYNFKIPNDFSFKQFEGSLLVNGWCADQLFGFAYAAKRFPHLYSKPYKEALYEIFSGRNRYNVPSHDITDNQWQLLFDVIDQYAQQIVRRKITLMSELSLLVNFGLKFTHVFNNMRLNSDIPTMINNVRCPYADPDIQDWAILNFDKNTNPDQFFDTNLYKLPLKQYIYQFNHDDQYLKAKGKTFSWRISQFADLGNYTFSIKTDQGYDRYQFVDQMPFDVRVNPVLRKIVQHEFRPGINWSQEY